MISLKKMTVKDIDMVYNWLKKPHVQEVWTNTPSLYDDIYKKYSERISGNKIFTYIMIVNGKEIGLIQTYITEDLKPYLINDKSMGIDLFIGEENYLGKGYGPLFIRKLVEDVCFINEDVMYINIDPDENNGRAIKAYKKVGFKHVNTALCNDCGEHNNYYMLMSREDFKSVLWKLMMTGKCFKYKL